MMAEGRTRIALVRRKDGTHVAETDLPAGAVPSEGGRRYAVCGARYTSVHTPSLHLEWNRKRVNCRVCDEWLVDNIERVCWRLR